VSNFVQSQAFSELTAAETRLTEALARPRSVAIGCIVVLTAFGWLALAMLAARSGGWQALCRVAPGIGIGELAVTLPMWLAMTLAMMLPTAGPMILTYAEIADTAARRREPVVSPLVLAAGYVAVWIGFALFAAALQFALPRDVIDAGRAGAFFLFLLAGLYQFSSLKRACLTLCQRPFPFFFANWTAEPRGVFRLGLRQGLYCLGCCWAMMLLMFAAGAMNVVWMAALGIVMTVEKLSTTTRCARLAGVAFVAIGLGFIGAGLM
jgi:predicted metal-binding membrane protein